MYEEAQKRVNLSTIFLSDCEITKNSFKTKTFLRLFLSIPNIFCIFVLIIAQMPQFTRQVRSISHEYEISNIEN